MKRFLILALMVLTFPLIGSGAAPQEGRGQTTENIPFNYEQALVASLGSDYFEGRALRRAEDQVILGKVCAVFQVGTNAPEKFTTEEWLAVDTYGSIYTYDIVFDEWSLYSAKMVENALYMLNEIYSDSFNAELSDSAEDTKKAVYESERAFNNNEDPAMLIPPNASVPSGYIADPLGNTYVPVYNFSSKAEVHNYFSQFFTKEYMENMQWRLEGNFFEFDGEFYLVRSGMGYGVISIDLDSLDISTMKDDALIINTLAFGEFDGNYRVEFVEEDGVLKINSDFFISMYDRYNTIPGLEGLGVPDFLAFASNNMQYTKKELIVSSEPLPSTQRIIYLGEYDKTLPEYAKIFELFDFEVIVNGDDGFYMFEKYYDDFTLSVDAYFMVEEEGVIVEISKL